MSNKAILTLIIFVILAFSAMFAVQRTVYGSHICGTCPAGYSCGADGTQCCEDHGCACQGCNCTDDPENQPASCPSVCYNNICGAPAPTNTPAPQPTNTPVPTLAPCGGIVLSQPEYECIDDTTANILFSWTPIIGTLRYQLQVARDPDFNDLVVDTEIGTTVHYRINEHENPHDILFSRVRVVENQYQCPSGYSWSNRRASLHSCLPDTPPPDIVFDPFDDVFCDPAGNPTNDPSTGLLYTAIGCVPVDEAQSFTVFVIRWSVNVAGAITFILIVYSGYLYMTSKGDANKIMAAKELLTAAVAGLALLILASFLYRTIAVDILGILTR